MCPCDPGAGYVCDYHRAERELDFSPPSPAQRPTGQVDLDEVRRRVEAATEGPWWAWDRGVGWELALGTPADVDEYGRPLEYLPQGINEDTLTEADARFIAAARSDVPALLADLDAAREALRRVEQERDEARRLNAICTCYDGNPQNYEGPHADCPIHGAIRAFNEASANLAAALEQRDDARAGLAAAEAKLAKPCGECHPCTEWPAETWRRSAARLPTVQEWNDLVAIGAAAQADVQRMRPVVEALVALVAALRSDAPRIEAGRAWQAALDRAEAAVDTYETQEGTE